MKEKVTFEHGISNRGNKQWYHPETGALLIYLRNGQEDGMVNADSACDGFIVLPWDLDCAEHVGHLGSHWFYSE